MAVKMPALQKPAGAQRAGAGTMTIASRTEVIACHACATIQIIPPMTAGSKAQCATCGRLLHRRVWNSVERALALYIAALVLFVVANLFPIMTLAVEGRTQATTILSGAEALGVTQDWPVAIVVLLAGTLLPLLKILGNLYVLIPVYRGRRPLFTARVFRFVQAIRPWSMMEIYLLGLIVAYVKLSDLATIELDIAMVAFVALILAVAAADATVEPHQVWARLAPQAGPEVLTPQAGTVLLSCRACDQLTRLPSAAVRDAACPRCRAALHLRRPDSLMRCTALVVTATILYVPANVLPIMTVTYFGSSQPNTILSGVIQLAREGMWPIAFLVFFASILVPVLKLLTLSFLVITAHLGRTRGRRDRTILHRLVEGIGRWSMVDIFVVAILTALVRLDNLASVEPQAGAIAFAAVVIISMMAAMAFDPRLIWDSADGRDGKRQRARA